MAKFFKVNKISNKYSGKKGMGDFFKME